MKIFTPIILSILFLLPFSVDAQFCCCPICPAMGGNNVCLPDAFSNCTTTCAIQCGVGIGEPSTNPTCSDTPSCGVVPIELAHFEVKPMEEGVNLIWETASEANNEGFEIQRASGITLGWETLSFVNGAGTSQTRNYYEFQDRSPLPGVNYYRLKQVDYGGSSANSMVKSATLREETQYILWPSLAKDKVFIKLNEVRNHQSEHEIVISDFMGRIVHIGSFIGDSVELDISTFPKGNYIANINSKGLAQTLRFMKVE